MLMSITGNRVWEKLSLYESAELVKSLHKCKHGKDVSDSRAKEIASLFAQAHEYFRSAEEAGQLVRPLILYYGAMALARGSVLFLDKGSTPAGTHGLKEEQWQDLNAQRTASSIRTGSSVTGLNFYASQCSSRSAGGK